MVKKSKWKKRIGIALMTLVVLTVAAWVFRVPLLQGAAEAWMVADNDLRKADAIVVLGGNIETRPFGAADLFEQGLAERVLVSKCEISLAAESGVTATHHDQNIAVLHNEGVPAQAISLYGEDLSSTWEEVCALRQWAQDEGKNSLIVVTEVFPSRRVRWLFDRHCPELDVQLHVVSHRSYDASNWWQDEQGLIGFQNELIKNVYYRVNYRKRKQDGDDRNS